MQTADGSLSLINHIEKAARQECTKLKQLADSRGITLAEAVLEFLERYKAEIKVKKDFILDYQVLDKPFDEVLEAHEYLSEKMKERHALSNSKQNLGQL